MTKTRKRILIGLGVAVVGALVGWFFVLPRFATRITPHIFSGTIIQSNAKAPNTELMSADGPVRLTQFQGKILVMYFGYTFCPDVCPATLSKLADVVALLGDKAEGVQVVMVSIDPERDTPEAMKEYVTHFDPSFLGLTGDEATVNLMATLFGVSYTRVEGTEATDYTMDHTATVILTDKDGYVKLMVPFTTTAEDLASDIEFMLSK